MTPERLQQIEELFHSALALEPHGRADFLARACEGDEALRREVESLLKSHDQGESFIEQSAADVAAELLAGGRAKLEAGRRIARYEIKSLLGEGGMGEVYLARDTHLDRPVALKLLSAHFMADEEHVRRFQREALAASALNHPNIVTVHEVGEWNGRDFLVTEYVEGVTLRTRMRGRRLSPAAAIDIALQVAGALSAAHDAGIVHRDIKPENVVLRPDGLVKVLDFGIAKYAGPARGRDAKHSWVKTATGVVIGTTAYMSPEQARGQGVDARTDVWSLGVILYEMVTRRLPFPGKTPTDRVAAILEREPEPLSHLRRGVPAELERIVGRALAKDRDERYARAADLAEDLRKLRVTLGAEPRFRFALPAPARGLLFSRKRRAVALAALLLVTTAALVAGLSRLPFRQTPTPAPQTEIKSLAVLPLENPSGDASQDYFADGVTEALITDLAKVGALRVISWPSVMQYKGARRALPEIGRELNVDAVLTGTVVRSGERVRIAGQLIHATTGRKLWAGNYERELRDVLSLQREVTRDVVGELRVKLSQQEQAQVGEARTVNPEAYDHYLRGRFYLNRQTKGDNEAAITALERAVAADPTFAAAHAELAQAYVWKLFFFAPGEEQWAEKAFVAAEKALALDPDSGVAHLARGRILWTPANRFPHEKAIREYRRSLTLDPTLDEARNQLAVIYCHIGAFDEALQESREAVAMNPNNNLANLRIGQVLNFQGKYEQALSVLRSIPLETNPPLAGHQIAWALFNLGRKEEAAATLEQLLRDYPEDTGGVFTSMQAVLAASAGQERMAEDKIRSAVEKGKGFGHFHHTAYHIACAYALMDKPEQAIKWLEAAAEDGFPCYPLFERDTNLDNLRQDARFVTFLTKLRQQWEHYRTIL
ncbi:MAG TPA: protein kinase [Pyrinomonadaceae bacterium]|nr:protein kinase [Pyrinomonadaceae bacterium]